MKQRKFRFKITTRGVHTNVKRLSSGATTGVLAVLAFSSLSARAEDCESLCRIGVSAYDNYRRRLDSGGHICSANRCADSGFACILPRGRRDQADQRFEHRLRTLDAERRVER